MTRCSRAAVVACNPDAVSDGFTMPRTSTPILVSALVLSLGIGTAGSFAFRKSQLNQSAQDSVVVSIADTTEVAPDVTLLSVDSTVAVDTTLPPVETTEPPATEPPTTVPANKARTSPQMSTTGAQLRPISGTERRLYDEGVGCASLLPAGSSGPAECDRVEIGGVAIAWVTDASGGVDILQSDPAVDEVNTWNVQLRAVTPPERRPRLTDVTGDGQPELVVGWRNDSGELLVDIVEVSEGNAGVSLHLNLVGGRITVGDGEIEAWNGVPADGDSPADPSSFDRWTYSKDGGRWVATAVRDDDPPSSQI